MKTPATVEWLVRLRVGRGEERSGGYPLGREASMARTKLGVVVVLAPRRLGPGATLLGAVLSVAQPKISRGGGQMDRDIPMAPAKH